jgi:hypothetical protein
MSYTSARGSSSRAGRSSYGPSHSAHNDGQDSQLPWPPSRPDAATARRIVSGPSSKPYRAAVTASPRAVNDMGSFNDVAAEFGGSRYNGVNGNSMYPPVQPNQSMSSTSTVSHSQFSYNDFAQPLSLESPPTAVSLQQANSLSNSLRGRRAPAPAALDLRPSDGWDSYVQEQHYIEVRPLSSGVKLF